MKQKTKTTPRQEALKKIRGGSESERLIHRLHSVLLVLHGYSASEAARIFEDSPRAVSYWVKRFEEKGVEGLRSESRSGRPASLDQEQLMALKKFLKDQERKKKVANAKAISHFIKRRFGIDLTERHCWRILKRLKA